MKHLLPAIGTGQACILQWFRQNRKFLLIACSLFLINQLIELIILKALPPYGYNSLCRLDCHGYSSIVRDGYKAEYTTAESYQSMSNWAFFPLLPALAGLLHNLMGFSAEKAIVVTGKLFFLGSIFLFIKFAMVYAPAIRPVIAGGVAALNPYAIYGNVGYTEPLFLFFTCLLFLLLNQRLYLLSGISGAFLSSVRLVGIIGIIPYIYALIVRRSDSGRSRRLGLVIGLLIIPTGLIMFMLHMYERTGDALAFANAQAAWGRPSSVGALSWLANLRDGYASEFWLNRYNAFSSTLALLVPIYFFIRKQYDLALFSLFCTLLPLSSLLWSLPRYIWWQAPVLLAVASVVSLRKSFAAAWFSFAIVAQFLCYRQWFSPYDWYISIS
jgi:hypothetical protein